MKQEKFFSEFKPATKKEWESAIRQELKGKDFDSLTWKTEEGLDIHPFYVKEDMEQFYPGRSFRAKNDWEIRENIEVDSIKTANAKALKALNCGADSLNFVLKKINSKNDFSLLLKNILPEFISINFTCEHNPLEILEWFKEFIQGEKEPGKISGSIIFEPFENKKLCNNTFEIAKKLSGFSPFFRGITVASFDQNLLTKQISGALAKGNYILKTLTGNGLSIDEVAARIQFFFPAGNNYFFEIAKIRAMRILWARIVGQYKPAHECSLITFIHSEIINSIPENQDAGSANNKANSHLAEVGDGLIFISNTTRVMSAAIGGADSISIQSGSGFSGQINRNIQLMAKEESCLNQVADASEGSYYIEMLTQKMAEKAWEIFETELKIHH